MSGFFRQVDEAAAFNADKAAKADLFRGSRLFVGLNCFEAGQSQATHVHPGADKFYLVVSGRARMTVGVETREAGPGTVGLGSGGRTPRGRGSPGANSDASWDRPTAPLVAGAPAIHRSARPGPRPG